MCAVSWSDYAAGGESGLCVRVCVCVCVRVCVCAKYAIVSCTDLCSSAAPPAAGPDPWASACVRVHAIDSDPSVVGDCGGGGRRCACVCTRELLCSTDKERIRLHARRRGRPRRGQRRRRRACMRA